MDSIFHMTNSISAPFTSETSESRRIVQSEEITIEDFTKNIDDWKILKNFQTQIIKIPNMIFSKQILLSKLKKEIFSLQNPLKSSNSFLKNPYKNI